MHLYRELATPLTRHILPVLLALLWPCLALAQQVLPPSSASALVCAYNTTPPAITTGSFAYVQCDANGKLLTSSPAAVTLAQSRVPMILPSSGSMANNGALTLTTALDQAYPAAYFYMPLGAIVAASPAGFYYGTMQSTTAVTLFNNLYVSGTSTIPASPTAFATTGPGAYTQTTGVLLSANLVTIPGGTLGANDEVFAHGSASYNNTAGVKNVSLGYGGSFTYGAIGPSTTASNSFQGGFANAGIVTRQNQTGLSNLTVAVATGTAINGAINSAADQNLTAALKIAVATDYIILQSYVAQRITAASN